MVGETIGSYKIIRLLGAGAMGEVYLAEHRHLKRQAALKLLARELVGRPDLLERFFLEARATSAIPHPAIVQIFDCEVDATGRPYIVMEYLQGRTLAAMLTDGGPLPPATAARLVRSIADALGAAHAKGIVHRDLKPDNVFVVAEPADTIKLVDFGIAKLAGDFRAGQVHQTRSGAMMGTPLYMSPEQCRDSANLDFRTDLYSLGCVAFEMVTGRPPFVRDALGDLIVAHMTEQPPDAREVNPSVPAPLAGLIGDLLKKNPLERPGGMLVVAERVAAFVGGLTAVSRTGGVAQAPAATAGSATTFGDAASELVPDTDIPGGRASRRRRIIAGTVIAAAVAAGAVYALRRPGTPAPLAPVEPAAAAVTAPGPSPAVRAPAAQVPARPREAAAATPAATAAGSRKRANKKASSSEQPPEATAPSPAIAPAAEIPAPPAAAAAAEPAATVPSPAPHTPPPAAGASGVGGTWEGPWVDTGRQQRGRFYLSIGSGGVASGWMSNADAQKTFRMVGRMAANGYLDLACQCPPNQMFWARGILRTTDAGQVQGGLTLLTSKGAFGQSQLSLERTTAKHGAR
jgi:tRNA A-37 threonylcarbamoyl transferase component Bud32